MSTITWLKSEAELLEGAEPSPELSWVSTFVPELSLVPASAVPQSVTADSVVSGICASPPVFPCVCGDALPPAFSSPALSCACDDAVPSPFASPALPAVWDDSPPGCAPDEPPAPHPEQTAAITSVKMSIKITADFLNTVKPPLLLKDKVFRFYV